MAEERALATVELITELVPIEGADSIQIAKIRGWDVVVRIGEFEVGDMVIYFEIDSFLPLDDPRFAFLAPRGARKNSEGVEGHVLKTARMRGKYSQGLALPIEQFMSELEYAAFAGENVTDRIPGLEKWDPPIPGELAGFANGPFPSNFRQTDEERVQNLEWVFEQSKALPDAWVATEKIDGSSMTVFLIDGEEGVASRNWSIEDTKYNPMWRLARKLDLHEKMRDWYAAPKYIDEAEIALQGEIFGPGIQGNPLQVQDVEFRLFTIQYDRVELPRDSWPQWALDIAVPVHDLPYPSTVEESLEQVENLKSLINPQRPIEGIVWRNTEATQFPNGARASWKAISQRYLLKHDR